MKNPLERRTLCGTMKKKYGHDYFEGTYAHDVAGYDEETIYDAFDGEPDAY